MQYCKIIRHARYKTRDTVELSWNISMLGVCINFKRITLTIWELQKSTYAGSLLSIKTMLLTS